jgi:hypothetical protein
MVLRKRANDAARAKARRDAKRGGPPAIRGRSAETAIAELAEHEPGVGFWDVAHDGCRWPFHWPGSIYDFRWCGQPVMTDGCSWCPEHARKVFAT